MEDLRNESWIVRAEAHPVVEVLQRSAHDAGFEPTIGFLANDYQEAQAMVSVGMGVAMVPKTAVALQHPDVRVLSLGFCRPASAGAPGTTRGQGLRPGRSRLPVHTAGNRPRTGPRLSLDDKAARAVLARVLMRAGRFPPVFPAVVLGVS